MNRRMKWIGLLSLLPILALFVFIVFICYRESIASSELKQKLDKMRLAGEPFDNDSMAKFFEKISHKEGTMAWTEVLELSRASTANQLISADLPFIGIGKLPLDLRPASEWPDEPRIAEFLREVRPVIQRVLKADVFPKPVWMPIEFNGFSTLLGPIDDSRTTARLLELDAIHALYHQEGERALSDIFAMHSVADAFDWRLFIVANLSSIALQGTQQSTINRSLSMNVWNEVQLAALSAQVNQPYGVINAWKTAFSGERGMAYSSMDDLSSIDPTNYKNNLLYMLPVLPSTRLSILRSYERLQCCADAGESELAARVNQATAEVRLENGLISQRNLYLALMFPGGTAMAYAIDRHEMDRRLTYTSLAVKRFQLKNKRWPEKLSALTDVGLLHKDWTTTENQPFGFEVKGECAYVWSYEAYKEKSVSAIRPVVDLESPEESLSFMVTIR